jgi:SAM-dependent methyltransferase
LTDDLGALDPSRCEEARLLVRNEFSGLDEHQQYLNAFARVLKWDPLGRVTMLGTDQRDAFAPAVRTMLGARPRRPHRILDVGCGDGATFQLFAHDVPTGSVIDLIDPNPDYVAAYEARLGRLATVRLGAAHVAPFAPDPEDARFAPPLARDYDVILALHSLYFFDDLAAAFADLYARLAPGGAMIVVFADEAVAYTGVCYRAYAQRLDPNLAAAHSAACAERLALLAGDADVEPRLKAVLGAQRIDVLRQPTRLFGHSLADLVALCNISGLSAYPDLDKFDAALTLLAEDPQRIGLRIETEPSSPRLGMLSVRQPQVIATILKPAIAAAADEGRTPAACAASPSPERR